MSERVLKLVLSEGGREEAMVISEDEIKAVVWGRPFDLLGKVKRLALALNEEGETGVAR